MIPRKNYQVNFQRVNERLYFIKQNMCFEVNEVGYDIWDLSNGKRTIEEIVDTIFKKYGAPREEIKEDVLEYLDLLVEQDILNS